MNIVWDALNKFFSFMWIYSVFEICYMKIYTEYKKEVIFMVVTFLLIATAVTLQGIDSTFLYPQYKNIKTDYKQNYFLKQRYNRIFNELIILSRLRHHIIKFTRLFSV